MESENLAGAVGAQRGERRLAQVVSGVALALRLGELALRVVVAAAEHVIALGLELGGVAEQDRHRRQEHRRGLAALPGPDEPPHGLREEQRGAVQRAAAAFDDAEVIFERYGFRFLIQPTS